MPQANSSSFKSAAEPEIQKITGTQDLTKIPEIRRSPNRTLRGPDVAAPFFSSQRALTDYVLPVTIWLLTLSSSYRTSDWLSGTTMPVGRLIFR